MKRIIGFCFLLSLTLLLFSCNGDKGPENIEGWAPVYQSSIEMNEIKSIGIQPIKDAGKIYVKGNDLYQIENKEGIHVMDMSNPQLPVRRSFIQLPGAQEISIKENYLYANNFNDLVVLDISDPEDVKVIKRLKDVFQLESLEMPAEKGYFECVDPSKGKVVKWEKKMLNSPKCRF